MTIAYTDGGCRGNPGLAAFGVYIERPDGTTVEFAQALALWATNNVAEYCGLIAALRWAVAAQVPALTLRSDSQLMVYQLLGRYAIRQPQLIGLYKEAVALAGQIPSVTYEYIPRAQNTKADALCTAALGAAQAGCDHKFVDTPYCLKCRWLPP